MLIAIILLMLIGVLLNYVAIPDPFRIIVWVVWAIVFVYMLLGFAGLAPSLR